MRVAFSCLEDIKTLVNNKVNEDEISNGKKYCLNKKLKGDL